MGLLRSLAFMGIGAAALWMVGKAVLTGAIDLGGKRGGTFLVTFADDRGAFLVGLVLMLVLGAGAVAVGWRGLTRDDGE